MLLSEISLTRLINTRLKRWGYKAIITPDGIAVGTESRRFWWLNPTSCYRGKPQQIILRYVQPEENYRKCLYNRSTHYNLASMSKVMSHQEQIVEDGRRALQEKLTDAATELDQLLKQELGLSVQHN